VKKIRIGTRGSKLALWQTSYVASLLAKGGVESEVVVIETKGDKQLNVSISKIGGKGVFTEEIEQQLKEGNIDIAVHSAKDMQSQLPEGLELIAFTEREKVNDVVISLSPHINLADPEIVLGTSSTRRVAMLKHFYPGIKIVDMRGNLQTRIRKMEEGHCNALLLAFAGVNRMEYGHMIVETLPEETFIPAVGQGSIAVETASGVSADIKEAISKLVNHVDTELLLRAERSFLARLQGGCSVPIFALATSSGDELSISGGIISLDGKRLLRKSASGRKHDAEQIGKRLAEEVIDAGGDKMLEEIKNQLR
jgi:hydroxymethylbilane synthase